LFPKGTYIKTLNPASWKFRGWIIPTGRILFALGFIGLALVGFFIGDFVVGRPPAWSVEFSPPRWTIYLSNTLLLLAGLFILFQRMIQPAGLTIAFLILLLSISRHFPVFLRDWTNAYKALALFGGSLITACYIRTVTPDSSKCRLDSPWRKDMISGGILLMAVFFLACGYAHFKFADFVIHFIPDYIPFHSFWAYFSGICLLAGGIGFLVPSIRQYAAFLSGLMMLAWFFLVHIPRTISNPGNTVEAIGLFESLAFSGILLVISGLKTGPR
jgi:uncharacterized membrane protein